MNIRLNDNGDILRKSDSWQVGEVCCNLCKTHWLMDWVMLLVLVHNTLWGGLNAKSHAALLKLCPVKQKNESLFPLSPEGSTFGCNCVIFQRQHSLLWMCMMAHRFFRPFVWFMIRPHNLWVERQQDKGGLFFSTNTNWPPFFDHFSPFF